MSDKIRYVRGLSPESAGEAPGRGRLKGRRILVVGGGQRTFDAATDPVGNGRAMSLLFAKEGAHVAVADVNRASADDTVQRKRRIEELQVDKTHQAGLRRAVCRAMPAAAHGPAAGVRVHLRLISADSGGVVAEMDPRQNAELARRAHALFGTPLDAKFPSAASQLVIASRPTE